MPAQRWRTPRTARSCRFLPRDDSDACIDDATTGARRERHDWIEVELRDLRDIFREAGDPQQHVAQSVEIRRRPASMPGQQTKPVDLVQQIVRVSIRQRRNPETHVTYGFNVDAADPKSH